MPGAATSSGGPAGQMRIEVVFAPYGGMVVNPGRRRSETARAVKRTPSQVANRGDMSQIFTTAAEDRASRLLLLNVYFS